MYASRTKGKPKAEGACKVARKAGRTGTPLCSFGLWPSFRAWGCYGGAALAEASLSLL